MHTLYTLIYVCLCAMDICLSAADTMQPTLTAWGDCTLITNVDAPDDFRTAVHSSARLNYIIQSYPKKESLQDFEYLGTLIKKHIRFDTNYPQPLTLQNIADSWHPIEDFIQSKVNHVNLACFLICQNKLVCIQRGGCGLYHVRNTHWTTPASADLVLECNRNALGNNKTRIEKIPLIGITDWDPGDIAYICTPFLRGKIDANLDMINALLYKNIFPTTLAKIISVISLYEVKEGPYTKKNITPLNMDEYIPYLPVCEKSISILVHVKR